MGIIPDLRERNLTDKEDMDLAEANVATLLRTVRRFRLINMLFSASRKILRDHVFSIMERDRQRHYTLLDVGAGGCDIAVWCVQEARQRNLRLKVTALDNDLRILPVAQQAVRTYPEITLQVGNALELEKLGMFDFIFSNHFLHHLGWDEIKLLLMQALTHTRLALVMNDLRRTHWSYLGCSLLLPFFSHGSFAFKDGRLSIRRGFTASELIDLMDSSFPEVRYIVKEVFPARIVIVSS
ncbi:methyltransferase domain-containing protein [Pelotalea chapellei]|uniref:Methyltransferase domain-containing protein n=1 Tax=Pelotalea chapellei TaxID=44671 RepID=A0ABS5U9J9_9BACT|nr:methyltransferase domain-containing protein [Pelotalea chapellei]MBT1072363.1 methyltransferase domain-containing protein [Pelotalea chapellei]